MLSLTAVTVTPLLQVEADPDGWVTVAPKKVKAKKTRAAAAAGDADDGSPAEDAED